MTDIEHYIDNHPDRTIDIYKIESVVCKELGITKQMLRSKSRVAPYPMARFLCMDLIRDYKLLPNITVIGKRYGKKHEMVCHARIQVSNANEFDKDFRKMYTKIKIELN